MLSRSADSVLGMLIGVALNSAAMLVAARFLGPEGRGQMVVLTLVPTFAHIIMGCGLTPANLYSVARDPSAARAAVGNSLLWSAACGAILAAAALLPSGPIAAAILRVPPSALLIVAASTAAVMSYQHLSGVVQGLGDFALLKRTRVVHGSLMLGSVLLAGALSVFRTPIWFFIGWSAAHAVTAAWLLVVISSKAGPPALSFALLRSALPYGMRAQMSQLWELANTRADQILVSALASRSVLGVYSTGVAVVELLFHVPTALGHVAFWTSASGETKARSDVARKSGAVLALNLVAGVVVTGVVWVAAPTVFGPGFERVPLVVGVLVGPVALLASGRLLAACEMGQGRPGVSAAGAATSVVVTAIADLVLVGRLGATGAALGCAAGYISGAVVIALMFSVNTGPEFLHWARAGFRLPLSRLGSAFRAALKGGSAS